ncbi:hypothetical protein A9Q99_19170 [Gammaproteobacteria bacterium 45_16_T64]|nr:hypothetical protein A9Q99_19170 [Gammaproteobacteria bacterium 45_16_T64]
MMITTIEDPTAEESKPIEDGVLEYGLSQVGGVMPTKWAFHATSENKIIGGATGRVHLSQFYLDNLWVLESLRSRGYGTAIHEVVVARAQLCGCKRIQLNTLNEKAVALYTRLDYENIATVHGYADGFTLYYMAKEI